MTGRSMIEMLGILAIIAVLFIGGFHAFSQAMNKVNANNLSKDILQGAFMMESGGFIRNQPIGKVGILSNSSYLRDTDFLISYKRVSNKAFAVWAGNISKNVCTELFRMPIASALNRYIGEVPFENAQQCGASNTIAYTFTIPIKDNPTQEDADNGYIPPAQPCGGACSGCQVCDEASDRCLDTDSLCRADQFCLAGTCICQDAKIDIDGTCRDCADTTDWTSSKEGCAKCPNRSWFDGTCYAPCPDGSFRNDGGLCRSCTDSRFKISTSAEECARCNQGDRVFEVGVNGTGYCRKICSETQPIATEGSCSSCAAMSSSSYTKVFSKAECDKCGDSWFYRVVDNYGACYSPCAEGQIRNSLGQCSTCGGQIAFATAEICALCGDGKNFWDNQYDSCRSCGDAAMRMSTIEECHRCPNRLYVVDTCSPCSYTSHIYGTTEEECNRCPERSFFNKRCYFKCSEGDNYIRSLAEKCYACSEALDFTTTAKECAKCSTRVYNASTQICSLIGA